MKEFNLKYFSDKPWVFVLIKDGRILYRSKKQRLLPMLFCLKKYKAQMRGGMIFDKVVGRAAALLLCYGGVKKVLTPTISLGALGVLRRGGAKIESGEIVENILNHAGDDLCPMEKLSRGKSIKDFAVIMKV